MVSDPLPEAVADAAACIAGHVARTPTLHSRTLSALLGAEVFLKFENLQFTASFKERGAFNRMLRLTAAERARGVACMSAGNHAQAVAHAARELGVRACVVMPRSTPNAKVANTRVLGAEVILHGATFDATRAFTLELAQRRDLVLVHPYDDPHVVAGQGTAVQEMLADVAGLDTVVVPVGGGGLAAGSALAIALAGSTVGLVGVQSDRHAAVYRRLRGLPETEAATLPTIADGIAVKTPGELPLRILRRSGAELLTMDETAIEEALIMLLDVEKTVAEGAGAVALAAVACNPGRFRGRRVGVVVSGGNVDAPVLAQAITRAEVRSRRRVRFVIELADEPGALGSLAAAVGELDSNIVEIHHHRGLASSSVRSVAVELVLQMRGGEQAERVLAELSRRGYDVRWLDGHG
jgi:threonine dehydratase